MASNIPGVRRVRCPKCRSLLSEPAEVPVYQCGGCGAFLRAKNHVAALVGGASSGSLENNLRNLSVSSSVDRESMSAVKPPIPCSLDVDGGDLAVSNTSSANNPDKTIEGRSSGDPSPTEQFSEHEERIRVEQRSLLDERADKRVSQSPRDCGSLTSEERVQAKQRHSPDEQTEKSMNSILQDCDSSRPSDKVDQSLESIAVDAAASEDMKLAAGSSHSYDGSASSPDRSQDNQLPRKYLLLSRRTFRHKKVLNSTDGMAKGPKVSGQQLPEKSADERVALDRDATFGSEDFHSVQNWIGSETDSRGLESLPKDLPLPSENENPSAKIDCLEPDHMKILQKVDELRDELSGFITRTVEGKRASHVSRRFSRIPISGRPPCSFCLPRPHNMYSQSNLPSYLRKAPAEENAVEKSNGKEKKVPIMIHCRPVSGGAPFVICYKCWKLLQIPADFLVTRKRLHKLRCGACSQVLVFSFRPKVRTAPMTPIEAPHPPSEVDNHNDRRLWDPMSFSDDYGVSFARSHSSEAEPVLHVSRNSSYSVQGSDGRQVGCSRLHRLMGYNSATDLLFQTRGGADEGYESTEPGTPRFYRPTEDEPQERLRTPRRGSALQGLLKKGVRELSQGLESVKLRIHSNG